MTESGSAAAPGDETGVESMVAVYRHDMHKVRGRSHEHAAESFRGVRVNEVVPLGADRDAALLSRPRGDPEQTLDAHESWGRVSLVTGDVVSTSAAVGDVGDALSDLIGLDDAVELHATWLDATVPSVFSESPYYPYTSLKYHTLLAAALLDNYRSGVTFEELFVAVTPSGDDPEIVPHRTVLAMPSFALHITSDPGDRPAVRLGDGPARSFADVWARLPECPFDVGLGRRWRVLDAQLRRVRSWSAALQFVEEYIEAFEPGRPGDSSSAGGDGS